MNNPGSEEQEEENAGIQFHKLYQALMAVEARNRQIVADVIESVGEGRKPVVLTERREHLELLATTLSPAVQHLIVLKGGMGKKNLDAAMTQLTTIPEQEDRVVLAKGRYLGEGFDDARLDPIVA